MLAILPGTMTRRAISSRGVSGMAGQCLGDVVAGGGGGDLDGEADLAVDLNRQGDGGRAGQRGIGVGERLVGEGGGWPSRCQSSSAMCGASGATIRISGSARARGTRGRSWRRARQLDEPGDRGMVTQLAEIAPDGGDGGVQQPRVPAPGGWWGVIRQAAGIGLASSRR